MTRVKTLLGALGVVLIVLGSAGQVSAADDQGYCKRVQGNCSGNSECAGPHASQLPGGQEKKC